MSHPMNGHGGTANEADAHGLKRQLEGNVEERLIGSTGEPEKGKSYILQVLRFSDNVEH